MFDMSNDSHYFRGAEELEKAGYNRSGAIWEHSDGRRYAPLYEGKMFHHYDHRFGTFEGEGKAQAIQDTTLEEKQYPDFEPTPKYWVPEDEVDIRASRVPTRLKSSFEEEDAEKCLKILAEWVLGSVEGLNPHNPIASLAEIRHHLLDVLGPHATSTLVVGQSLQNWLSKVASRASEMYRYTPLTQEDLAFIKDYGWHWVELAGDLIARKTPRWLMGIRSITKVVNERTIVGGLLPKSGVGNSANIWMIPEDLNCSYCASLIANISCLPFDYIARQKVGGFNLNLYHVKQLPALAPNQYNQSDLEFVRARVLELTYTSHSMRPWAEDLGYTGAPYAFNPCRRAQLRAELDAFFAKKYGLTRDELRYVLDPHCVKGKNYPSETFRTMKNNEMLRFKEYRTQRLVLEAFDRITKH